MCVCGGGLTVAVRGGRGASARLQTEQGQPWVHVDLGVKNRIAADGHTENTTARLYSSKTCEPHLFGSGLPFVVLHVFGGAEAGGGLALPCGMR